MGRLVAEMWRAGCRDVWAFVKESWQGKQRDGLLAATALGPQEGNARNPDMRADAAQPVECEGEQEQKDGDSSEAAGSDADGARPYACAPSQGGIVVPYDGVENGQRRGHDTNCEDSATQK